MMTMIIFPVSDTRVQKPAHSKSFIFTTAQSSEYALLYFIQTAVAAILLHDYGLFRAYSTAKTHLLAPYVHLASVK